MNKDEQFKVKEYKIFRKLIYPLPGIPQLFFTQRFNPNLHVTFPQNAEALITYIKNIFTGMGIAFDKDAYWEPTNCVIHFMATSQIYVGIYYAIYSLYNLQPDYQLNTLDYYLNRCSPPMLKEYDTFMSTFTKKEEPGERNPIFPCQAPIDTSSFKKLISQLPYEAQTFLLTKYNGTLDRPTNQQEILSSIEESIIELSNKYINRYINKRNYHYRRLIAQSRFLVTIYYAANTVYGKQQGHAPNKLDAYLYKEINTFS